jgi:hypothetical protein
LEEDEQRCSGKTGEKRIPLMVKKLCLHGGPVESPDGYLFRSLEPLVSKESHSSSGTTTLAPESLKR